MTHSLCRRIVLLLLAACLYACARDPGATPQPAPEPGPEPVVRVAPEDPASAVRLRVLPHGAETEAGPPVVLVEVAATYAARSRGLGGRTYLPDDHGMLFVYPSARPRTFWMKDCAFALDIAFLDDDARIVQLATLGPGAGRTGNDVPREACPHGVRYVLETNAGILGEHGVGTGDRIDVSAAIDGVTPE